MIRIVMAAGIAALGLGAGPAFAQASWTHEGITFPQTTGWCSSKVEEEDGSGGKTSTIHIQQCGKDFPTLSAGIAARAAAAQDLPSFTVQASQQVTGDTGKAVVDNIFKKKHASCTRLTYALDTNPVRNLPAFQVNATYSCPGLDTRTYQFHNTTAYAQQKNGNLWVVGYDSETATMTADEEAVIRGAVAAIASQ